MKRRRDILYLRCMELSTLFDRIVKEVCADPAGKENGNSFFTIAMASSPIPIDGGDFYLELAAPPAELVAFQNAVNDQTARDRAWNHYTFHQFADTTYPNLTSSSALGRWFDKTVVKLGSSSAGKVLRKMRRRRERFDSVEVDAIMQEEAETYAAQHGETNLANKRKAKALQVARRKKEALERSQAAQVSDVTGASVCAPELAEKEEGLHRELTRASGESGPTNGDRQLQPEKRAIDMDDSVAENEAVPNGLQPLETNMNPGNEVVQGNDSPSNDVEMDSPGGVGRMMANYDTDMADILWDKRVELALGDATGAVWVLRMALLASDRQSTGLEEDMSRLKALVFPEVRHLTLHAIVAAFLGQIKRKREHKSSSILLEGAVVDI